MLRGSADVAYQCHGEVPQLGDWFMMVLYQNTTPSGHSRRRQNTESQATVTTALPRSGKVKLEVVDWVQHAHSWRASTQRTSSNSGDTKSDTSNVKERHLCVCWCAGRHHELLLLVVVLLLQ